MNFKDYVDRLMIQMMPLFAQGTASLSEEKQIIRLDGTGGNTTQKVGFDPGKAQAECFNYCIIAGQAREAFWGKFDAMKEAAEKQRREMEAALHREQKLAQAEERKKKRLQ